MKSAVVVAFVVAFAAVAPGATASGRHLAGFGFFDDLLAALWGPPATPAPPPEEQPAAAHGSLEQSQSQSQSQSQTVVIQAVPIPVPVPVPVPVTVPTPVPVPVPTPVPVPLAAAPILAPAPGPSWTWALDVTSGPDAWSVTAGVKLVDADLVDCDGRKLSAPEPDVGSCLAYCKRLLACFAVTYDTAERRCYPKLAVGSSAVPSRMTSATWQGATRQVSIPRPDACAANATFFFVRALT